ncbi:Gfo/Idh/MocA family oxidoreductase [Paenibacillus sp. 7124]|uniref:Gfo/Idh/MocA family oxidoreductase n=1 Tax=Paenibacillus apii TaxID=1850370 RepID=A0A6M1PIJ7_9BACL|nr:Gfo/Idh/MocA family oxidoreductase [Paenibacillus apii]NGM82202.1 Gfo/Idh/MocA family oxidoreductase [Paenibacillus apii]NJJ39339.1 Gfo/Idh/MocA family oxidoreductase [Paenibacillus apii]
MTLNIGMVGTGWFAKVHADLLAGMADVKLQAVCGTSREKGEEMARPYAAEGYGDPVEMLDAHTLDAVYICVPPGAHGAIERTLIRRGIPFFVEKPLGVNTEIPASLLQDIQAAGLLTSVGYHFRYQENVKRLKEALQGDTIGMVVGQWMGSMPEAPWWRDQEQSGGQFTEQTTHIVDLLRYLAGEVTEVYAMFGNRVMHEKKDGVSVADVGTVSLKLASGIVANISNTCVLPGEVGRVGLSFYNDSGLLDWNPQRLLTVRDGDSTEYANTGNPYVSESEAFLHAVRTGDRSGILSDYADAYKTLKVTCAAFESARKEAPVKL